MEAVTVLVDAVSSSQSQSQLLLLSEDVAAVSSDGVDSRLAVLLSWDKALDIVELVKNVLDVAISARMKKKDIN